MVGTSKLDPVRPAWFWSELWQQMEREVDEHIARGEVERHDDAQRFLSFLQDIGADVHRPRKT